MTFLKKQNYKDQDSVGGCQVLGVRGIFDYQGQLEGIFGDEMVIYPECSGGYVSLCTCPNS